MGQLRDFEANKDELEKVLIMTDHRPLSAIMLGKLLIGRGNIYCQKVVDKDNREINELTHNYYNMFKNNVYEEQLENKLKE